MRGFGDGEVGVVGGRKREGRRPTGLFMSLSGILCFVPKLYQCGIRLACTNSLTEQKYNNLAWLYTVYSVSLLAISVGTQQGRMPLSLTETQQETVHSNALTKSTAAQK